MGAENVAVTIFDQVLEQNLSTNSNSNESKDAEELCLRSLSDLYLTLETKYFVSKADLQKNAGSLADLSSINLQFIKDKLRENGFNIEEESLVEDVFLRTHRSKNGVLRSSASRENYYKTNLIHIEPIKVDLCNDKFIPILKSLECIRMQKKCFRAMSWTYTPLKKLHVLTDIIDGKCYNTLFS